MRIVNSCFLVRKLFKHGFNDLSFNAINVQSFTVSLVDYIKVDYYLPKKGYKKNLFDLFFFGRSIDRKCVEKIFSPTEVAKLVLWGIISLRKNTVKSLMKGFFYGKYLFFCDFPLRYAKSGRVTYSVSKNRVFLPSLDSYYFSEFIGNGATSVLDLGTGCGFLAILASEKNAKIYGVDINNRAIKLANLNKKINNIRNIDFRRGDLFHPFKGQRFDLVISNPPHGVNSPEINKIIAVNGGPDGLSIVRRIVSECSDHLTGGGVVKILMTIEGATKSSIKINLSKILSKNVWGIFYHIKTIPSFDYSTFNFRNRLFTDGFVPTAKKIYSFAKYLDKYRFKFFNHGLLVFKSSRGSLLKIFRGDYFSVERVNKRIADFLQKN